MNPMEIRKGEVKMRTALSLLNEIIGLGFDQQKTLVCIDKILDTKLGIEDRKPLSDEKLPDIIYDGILGIFQEKAEIGTISLKNNMITLAIERIDGKRGRK
ncbi:MAG: hypothetical protein K0R19_1132 [Bacillota bacterium]|jgi:hypothetical protein|nr:hypothetical protein [Bacillota bacterium]